MPMFVRSLLTGAALIVGASLSSAQAAWIEKDLHDFSNADSAGFHPVLGVTIGDDGVVYGSAFNSKLKPDDSPGDGVVFSYANGKYTVLYAFDSTDPAHCGRNPSAILLRSSNGTLFGTTFVGGKITKNDDGGGVIFKLTPPTGGTGKWTCKALYTFSKAGPANSNQGYNPFGGLLRSNGIFYGTAQAGGKFGGGVVFSFDPATSAFTPLHYFSNASPTDDPKHNRKEGYTPAGRLVGDPGTALYGATYFGGMHQGGVIYTLTPSNGKFAFKVLHTFAYQPTAAIPAPQGYQPSQNGLLLDSSTNTLYGETFSGGQIDGNASNGGVAFKLTTSGAYSILHIFDDVVDLTGGFGPIGGLTMDANGDFYGVARSGGDGNVGAIFKMKKSGQNYQVLYSFLGPDGSLPNGPVSLDPVKGALYGTTYSGGAADGGVLFKLRNQP
jgi:uncharacterized repeat protein (TIGR03803 family)